MPHPHIKKDKEDECPVCHRDGLEYNGVDCSNGEAQNEWRCPWCGADGRAWYTVKFLGHEVTYRPENKMKDPDR